MTNPNAYLTMGAMLTGSALLIGIVWLIVIDNMPGDYIAQAPKADSGQPAIHEAVKPNHSGALPNPENPLTPYGDARVAAGAKPIIPQTDRIPDNHQATVQLYQENAENGNSDAQYKLGLLYLTGNGALQDFTEAAKWLKRAAEQGYARAQYELGLIYRTGYGLAPDNVQSYMWLNLAAAAGIQQAVMVRDEVMKSLSATQLAQAQKFSREWLASRPARHTSEAAKTDDNGAQPATTIPRRDTAGRMELEATR